MSFLDKSLEAQDARYEFNVQPAYLHLSGFICASLTCLHARLLQANLRAAKEELASETDSPIYECSRAVAA